MDTNKKKSEMIEALTKSLGNVAQSCKRVGISRATHYLWVEADPDYAKAVAEIDEAIGDFVESKGHQLVNEGNPTMIIFMLKTKYRKRGYTEASEVKIEHHGLSANPEEIAKAIADAMTIDKEDA